MILILGKSPNLRKKGLIGTKPFLGVILGGFHGGFLIWYELEEVY